MEQIRPGTYLARILDWCGEQDATDLHCQTNRPYTIRVHGRLLRVPTADFSPPSGPEIREHLRENFSTAMCERIENRYDADMSFYHGTNRYRANFSKQKGEQSYSFRIVPQQRLKLADLQLPETLADVIQEPRGLVLATGPTGQGKSTTIRALIQQINETRAARVVTIEDPIEYVFEDCLCQFEQREVGIDTDSFADGIRNAMRQDPNVIFVGEIRDRESIFSAMQAAETGHLVLTTLHADSVAQAIGRILEYYPSTEQANISSLLGRNINTILCQRLIPNVHGTRTPCLEILKRDAGVQQAIQTNNLHLLAGIVEVSNHQGMHTFDQYLIELHASGIVDQATVEHYAVNKHQIEMILRGILKPAPILEPDEDR